MKIYDKYLSLDYEGIIVRHIKSPYIKKHSRFMLKFKPKKDDYYEIAYATEAISKNGIPLGMIGAFECRDLEGTTFGIGAGKLTHDERRNLWKDRQSLIGKFCHVQYQSISPRGAPLFGLCIDITDENPEEASGGGIL
jgi:ATP-dependent DNA ligase